MIHINTVNDQHVKAFGLTILWTFGINVVICMLKGVHITIGLRLGVFELKAGITLWDSWVTTR
jgi:hypothetical protein